MSGPPAHYHSGETGTTGREPFEDGPVPVVHQGSNASNPLESVRGGDGNVSALNQGGNNTTYGSNTAANEYLSNTGDHSTHGHSHGEHGHSHGLGQGQGLTGQSTTGTTTQGEHGIFGENGKPTPFTTASHTSGHDGLLGSKTIGNANEGPIRIGQQTDTDRGKFDNVTTSHTNESSQGGGAMDKLKAAAGGNKEHGAHGHGNELGNERSGVIGSNNISSYDNNTRTEGLGHSTGHGHESGVGSGVGSAGYGQNIGDKEMTNQKATRHGDDFTGGFAATGGAYVNDHAKTGLTGRETTTTGVNDQSGSTTQSGGIVNKIKNALGGHHNNEAGANASHAPHQSNLDIASGSTAKQENIRDGTTGLQ